jgi:GNAT superfamily N-acetyltransferase
VNPSPYAVEPLGDHDRSTFRCSVSELDRYLRQQAGQDAKRRVAAPFVMVDSSRRILGYYTLSAYAVRLTELSPDLARKLPRYPLVPATLLGRLAVDREYRGRRLGSLLLTDALLRSLRNSAEVASIGVVAEAYDEAARNFYLHHEFIPLADHSRKVFVAMATIAKAFV